MLGLSENTVQNIRLVNNGYFKDNPYMLPLLNCLLSNKDFYIALERTASLQQASIGATPNLKNFMNGKQERLFSTFSVARYKSHL